MWPCSDSTSQFNNCPIQLLPTCYSTTPPPLSLHDLQLKMGLLFFSLFSFFSIPFFLSRHVARHGLASHQVASTWRQWTPRHHAVRPHLTHVTTSEPQCRLCNPAAVATLPGHATTRHPMSTALQDPPPTTCLHHVRWVFSFFFFPFSFFFFLCSFFFYLEILQAVAPPPHHVASVTPIDATSPCTCHVWWVISFSFS